MDQKKQSVKQLSIRIFQTIKQSLSIAIDPDQQIINSLIDSICDDIKSFIKDQQTQVTKDIAKKTKQLFILSSDNQSMKQTIDDLNKKISKLNQKIALKQKQYVKLMNDSHRQKQQLQQEFKNQRKQLKKQLLLLQQKIVQNASRHKSQLSSLRSSHKQQLQQAILSQQQTSTNTILQLKSQHTIQKKALIQNQNKQRSQLIKKYENKLQEQRDKNQDELIKVRNQFQIVKEKDSNLKNDLQNLLITRENQVKMLEGNLRTQQLGHHKYKQTAQLLQSQINQINDNKQKIITDLQQKLESLEKQMKQSNQSKKHKIQKLQQTLNLTICEKDLLLSQTIGIMQTQRQIQVETLKNNMIQEKQIQINGIQVRNYHQMEKLNDKYIQLEKVNKQLNQRYLKIKDYYQDKIKDIISQYQSTIISIQNRTQYELSLEGQTAQKNQQVLERKYRLQIKSLNKQFIEMKQDLTKKINQERLTTTNKLTYQYQTMINDLKISNDVAIKQKIIQSQRKSKGYQKKLSQAQKRRLDLKLQSQRQKLDSQMKLQSLMQIKDRQQSQIQDLHEHLIKMQKQKIKISNDYQFKLLVNQNKFKQLKDDYQINQQQLRNILNQKIRLKNLQISKFSQKVNMEVQQNLRKHNNRVSLIQKDYKQLKRIMSQRTSLPQDIQALKIFHKGYIQIEQQLQKQKLMRQNLQRELQSKCAIQKVFTSKAFVPKMPQNNFKNKILISSKAISPLSSREFYTKQEKLKKFSIHQFNNKNL